jgi:hypothetical protein
MKKNTTSAHAVSLNLHFDRMMVAVIYKKIMNDPAYHSMPLSKTKKFSLFLFCFIAVLLILPRQHQNIKWPNIKMRKGEHP